MKFSNTLLCPFWNCSCNFISRNFCSLLFGEPPSLKSFWFLRVFQYLYMRVFKLPFGGSSIQNKYFTTKFLEITYTGIFPVQISYSVRSLGPSVGLQFLTWFVVEVVPAQKDGGRADWIRRHLFISRSVLFLHIGFLFCSKLYVIDCQA